MSLLEFFRREAIDAYSMVDFSLCRVTNEALFARLFPRETPKFALVFLLPYFVSGVCPTLSRYAVAEDYHLYVKDLETRMKAADGSVLAVCADHSPIDERDAALRAGLGVRGKNGLLIHPKYGSFCFVATAFLKDAPEDVPLTSGVAPRDCEDCGACLAACPVGALSGEGECLSALSQKKNVAKEELELLKKHRVLWGCDVCQDACPHNRDLPDTPVAFFREKLIPVLTSRKLDALLATGEFSRRAYAWRGAATIRRNLENQEETDAKKDEETRA